MLRISNAGIKIHIDEPLGVNEEIAIGSPVNEAQINLMVKEVAGVTSAYTNPCLSL